MMHGKNLWQLARFDRPAGILLLWYPTAWALWFVHKGLPALPLLFLFFIGTVLMRAAGCVFNDIVDRHIDKHVARTKLRPLAIGKVNLIEAFFLLVILLFGALIVALNLPRNCFYLAVVALSITLIYPFGKRFLNAPQMVLGLAFSMGIPMAYVASEALLDKPFFLLFIINFIWIIAYDTMYAMADKEDDIKIGVKSTAIYFAAYDRLLVGLLLLCMHGLWFFWGIYFKAQVGFYIFWLLASLILVYQQKLIYKRIPQECFKAFSISVYYGLIMWLAVGSAFYSI